MSIKRITVSVPVEVARRIKSAAGRTPVSTWLTELIEEHLDDAGLERQWLEFCRDVNPGPGDARRAETMFKRLTKSAHRRRVA